jgi:hypothetical protein
VHFFGPLGINSGANNKIPFGFCSWHTILMLKCGAFVKLFFKNFLS